MNVSNIIPKQYLAVCEKSSQAICVVHDLVNTNRKPKYLTSSEYDADSFTDVRFAHTEERL